MPGEAPENVAQPCPEINPRGAFERFSRRLIGLARHHLDTRLQHKVDPEDVVQSVYKSLILRYGEGALEAEGWEGLWGLLTLITVRKCADRARFYQAERRDLNREVAPASESSPPTMVDAIGREPTPAEAIILAETVEDLLRKLDADDRSMIELSLQGYSAKEISEQTGRAERSVRRLRERVRKHLERQYALDGR